MGKPAWAFELKCPSSTFDQKPTPRCSNCGNTIDESCDDQLCDACKEKNAARNSCDSEVDALYERYSRRYGTEHGSEQSCWPQEAIDEYREKVRKIYERYKL